jgi:hypothetical protein
MAYSQESVYWPWIKELIDMHKDLEVNYDNLVVAVTNLAKQTAEWDKLFDEAKKNIQQREQMRSLYDHYDEKLEKLVKNRNEKFARGLQETEKEIERFERVIIKF